MTDLPTAEVTVQSAVARAYCHRIQEGRSSAEALSDVTLALVEALGSCAAVSARGECTIDTVLAAIDAAVEEAAYAARRRMDRRSRAAETQAAARARHGTRCSSGSATSDVLQRVKPTAASAEPRPQLHWWQRGELERRRQR